jgi:hypothetical protein
VKLAPRSSSWLSSTLPVSALFLLTTLMTAAPAAAATLKVSSFPSGAEVSIDGVNTGKVTPMTVALTEGDHVVTVSIPNSGWNADSRTVTIVAGNNDLSVTLLPVMTAGPPGPQGATGATGAAGPAGPAGQAGIDGVNGTSVTFVDYFSGSTYQGARTGCPNGGAVYASGNPPVNAYVCNGTNGADGTDGTATRAAGPCFDNMNRYVDCGNGTVTDTATGLIWLKDAACLGSADWAAANETVASLAGGLCGLTDGSSPGDWRLPTDAEWRTTTGFAANNLGCRSGNGPSLTDDAGTKCLSVGLSSFAGVVSASYWSGSTYIVDGRFAFSMDLNVGGLTNASDKDFFSYRVWPVRVAPR